MADIGDDNAQCQMYSNEWKYQKSMKFKTEKKHVQPVQTSEQLNAQPHPLYSMGLKRHYPEKLSETFKYRPHMKLVPQQGNHTDQGIKKIVENYVIVKPKVERIGGSDDFNELVKGKQIL